MVGWPTVDSPQRRAGGTFFQNVQGFHAGQKRETAGQQVPSRGELEPLIKGEA
jgi:hypothetical protein